jgi:hypothetical protein
LITILTYISYNNKYRKDYPSIGYFIRKDKITGRISDKKDVSNLIDKLALDVIMKNRFIKSIDVIEEFISLLSNIFNNNNQKEKLDKLFNIGGETSIYRRSLIDFYILFDMLKGFPKEESNKIDLNILNIDFIKLKSILKNSNNVEVIDEEYRNKFLNEKKIIVSKYKTMT